MGVKKDSNKMLRDLIFLIIRPRFTRNILWGMFGSGVPMIAALIVIPQLIAEIGPTRFGLLTLVWVIVGYFSLFDMGLGRALTQIVATRGASRNPEDTRLIWTAFAILGCVGFLGAGICAALVPIAVERFLSVAQAMRSETVSSLTLAAATIPIVVATSGLRGLIEGLERFDISALLRAPMGVLSISAPLFALSFTRELPGLVLSLTIVRVIGFVLHAILCAKLFPELRQFALGGRHQVVQLLRFGGWLTISNIVSPILMYSARIALAVMVSASAVSYFSIPNDIVINFLIFPSIVANVLYPRFASLINSNPEQAKILYNRAILLIALTSFPICLVAFIFCHPALSWWISPEFANNSSLACQLIIIGIYINGFAFLFEVVIQGSGRPDLTAKLHLFELLLYIPYLIFSIYMWQILGASIAWILRTSISTIGHAFIAQRCLNNSSFNIKLTSPDHSK